MKHYSEAELLERISGLEKRIQELELLVNAGPDFFFLKDLQLRYQLINSANANFFGRDEADILGRTDIELMPEEAALACQESDRQAIREKRMVVSVEPVGDRFYETRKFPVIDKGEIVSVAGIVRDITDRKQAELALRTSQLQLSEAMDLANIVYWEFDPADNMYTFDGSFYALYGTTAEQEGGYRMTREEYAKRFIHPDDQQFVHQFVNQNNANPDTEFVADIEHRIVRRDGEVRHILVRARIVKDNSGRIVKRYGANQDITERKRAEQMLRWKTALLEAQANTSLDGVLIVDENNRRISTNRRLVDLWDVPKDILDNEDDSFLLQYVLSLVKYPETFIEKVTYLYDHPDETSRDEVEFKNGMVLDRYSAPVIGEDGHYYGRIWTFRDITKHKRAEEALSESESKFRALAENSLNAIFVIQGEKYAYINPAFTDMTGYTWDDLSSMNFWDFISPDMREVIRARGIARQRGEQVASRYDLKIITKSGEERYASFGATLIEYKGMPAILASVVDITERKRGEEALRQSEELYRTLIAASPDAIAVADPTGCLTLASRKAVELFHIQPENDAIGRSFMEWIAPQDQLRAERAFRRLLTAGETLSEELELQRDDGTLFKAEVNASPIRSSDGAVGGAIGIIRDITEYKSLQTQLLQSQKMEAIGTLAGGIAHDFNNILMAIMGYTSLMEANLPQDYPMRSYLHEINSCASKAANLTRSLLTFSRKQLIELTPQSIKMILSDAEKLLRRLMPEDVEFIMSSVEDLIVMADLTQIEQVLINLASNAKDAMPKGGTLHIRAKVVELDKEFKQAHGFGEPGRYAMISVSDTGSGMDETTQRKIFEPFFTTKEVGKGTGLGLAIVYGIIKQHNGYITVSSYPDRGTTFDIYLPALKSAVSAETGREFLHPQGGTETLLLAEDDADVRKTAGEILRIAGYTVVEAADGADAVRKYMDHRDDVNLLILDVVMPKKNGKEAYEEIHSINPSVPALFMSGYTGDVVLNKGVKNTAVGYIPKPLSADELLKKIREVLEG